MQRIAGKGGKAVAALAVILDVLRSDQIDDRRQILPGQDGSLLRLIVIISAGVDGEADLERPVEGIGMGDSQGRYCA